MCQMNVIVQIKTFILQLVIFYLKMDSEKDIEKEHVLSKRLNKIIQARIENDEV